MAAVPLDVVCSFLTPQAVSCLRTSGLLSQVLGASEASLFLLTTWLRASRLGVPPALQDPKLCSHHPTLPHKMLVAFLQARADQDLSRALFHHARRGDLGLVDHLATVGANFLWAAPPEEGAWTPLHASSFYGHPRVAQWFLDHGARVSARTHNGCTPLHLAVVRGHTQVVQVLLNAGADPAETNDKGRTSLWLASTSGESTVVSALADWLGQDKKHSCSTGSQTAHQVRQHLSSLACFQQPMCVPQLATPSSSLLQQLQCKIGAPPPAATSPRSVLELDDDGNEHLGPITISHLPPDAR
uniref:Uncharacterized protein n=1 Tax=Rhizochromulina marina TaxID=1034831 RepID=A0A7S2WKM9_9STRA|mmetsp:Transcript_27457/g.80135  ORF Transcript_27457/g.80135 Transcript_27457/m.80135 type:complete len:300 (+) Transcript_27457:87-986(+)